MTSIHVVPESLHLVGRMFSREYFDLLELLSKLRIQEYRLEIAWQGGAAEEYQDDMRRLVDRLIKHGEEVLSMSHLLSHQAETWEACDQNWASTYQALSIRHPGE